MIKFTTNDPEGKRAIGIRVRYCFDYHATNKLPPRD